jgi:hypothetical protein
MKTYSMVNRKIKPSSTSRFSNQDKYDIMYKYLIQKMKVAEIYEFYRGRGVSLANFQRIPAYLMEDKELLDQLLKRMMTKVKYEEFKGTSKIMGAKEESYWMDEEEMLFQANTYETLSLSERDIYNNPKDEEGQNG